jgi:hypothetical protein
MTPRVPRPYPLSEPDDDQPAEEDRPVFIGPDYAAIRARDWARIHTLADNREPVVIAPNVGRRT